MQFIIFDVHFQDLVCFQAQDGVEEVRETHFHLDFQTISILQTALLVAGRSCRNYYFFRFELACLHETDCLSMLLR